jgi:glycerophosphoryl diester phosphodiesterase
MIIRIARRASKAWRPISLPLIVFCLLNTPGCFSTPSSVRSYPMKQIAAKPIVIAHRGASALRPEHTLAAYVKAIEDGADWIEPDLVCTRDGVLVARHENEISGTTDVALRPEFATRKTTKSIDGERVTGWFSEDFTLAELKTLRARERLPELRSTAYDGMFEIATFDEIISLAANASVEHGRIIGLAPEIKHPTYFASIGLAMEDKLLAALAAHPHAYTMPVIVQSFETANLRALRGKIGREANAAHVNIRLLQLLGRPHERPYDSVAVGAPRRYGEMMRASGLRDIATYADAIGPSFRDLDPRRDDDGVRRSRLVDEARAAGLDVIAYTYRPENYFLPREYRGSGNDAARHDAGSVRQIHDDAALGLYAFFTDDPALGRRAVDED